MKFRHGTRTGYANHGCKCDRCLAAHAAYNRDYKRGIRRWTSTAPAATHINELRANGWTLAALARHTGYHVQTLHNIARGRTLNTSHATVEDILSIPLTREDAAA